MAASAGDLGQVGYGYRCAGHDAAAVHRVGKPRYDWVRRFGVVPAWIGPSTHRMRVAAAIGPQPCDAPRTSQVTVCDRLQIVVLPRNTKMSLDEEKAHAGAQMMFECGDNLKQALRRTGMFVDMERSDGVRESSCNTLGTSWLLGMPPIRSSTTHHVRVFFFLQVCRMQHYEYIKMLVLRFRRPPRRRRRCRCSSGSGASAARRSQSEVPRAR